MPESLFREAVLAHRAKPRQPALLSKPISAWLLVAFSIGTIALLAIFATAFEFARKDTVAGHLVPRAGWSRVTASRNAVVTQCNVENGQRVEAGEVLLELSSGHGVGNGVPVGQRLLTDIAERKRALSTRIDAEKAVYEHRQQDHRLQIKSLDDQEARLIEDMGAHRRRVAIANRRLVQARVLLRRGGLSESDVITLADDLESRKSTLALKGRELEQLQAQRFTRLHLMGEAEASWTATQAALADQLHTLSMEDTRVRSDLQVHVLAPKNGRVSSLRIEVGDWIEVGDVIVDVIPEDAELIARLSVSSRAVGRVAEGQEVRVYLDSFPYERHGVQAGRVSRVSETTVGVKRGSSDLTWRNDQAEFQIDVEFPDGFTLAPAEMRALRPGMSLTADIVHGYGTLLDWFLDPIRRAQIRL